MEKKRMKKQMKNKRKKTRKKKPEKNRNELKITMETKNVHEVSRILIFIPLMISWKKKSIYSTGGPRIILILCSKGIVQLQKSY